MSRIYGKATQTLVTRAPASPANALIASMGLEEKLEPLQESSALDPD